MSRPELVPVTWADLTALPPSPATTALLRAYREARRHRYEATAHEREQAAQQAQARRRTRRLVAEHGTRWKYATGCRCEPCRTADATYRRELKERKKATA